MTLPPVLRLLVVFCVFASCKKATTIGLDVLPESDFVIAVFTDTFSLQTLTVKEDPVRTSTLVNNVAGNWYDPDFGRTVATLFTEFYLPTNNVDLGNPDTLFIDSVVLTLAYAGFYGYEDVPQSYTVYEVAEAMNPLPEEGWLSDKNFRINQIPLGKKTNAIVNLLDSVEVIDGKLPAHMRIRLNDRFGQRLLNQSGGANFIDQASFVNYFKGICLSPDTVSTPFGGGVMYINLLSPVSGLNLYYHSTNIDSLTYRLPVTSDVVKTNYYTHNYSGTEVKDHLRNLSGANDSIVYMQGLGGVKTFIRIPHIKTLENVIINKAELVIRQLVDDSGIDSIYLVPQQLVCAKVDTNFSDAVLLDQLDGDPFPEFGGNLLTYITAAGEEVAEYKFSISHHVQNVLNGSQSEFGYYLILFRRGETAGRIKAGGSLRSDEFQMKLNLIYTPLDQ
jgi:hypothetical protein